MPPVATFLTRRRTPAEPKSYARIRTLVELGACNPDALGAADVDRRPRKQQQARLLRVGHCQVVIVRRAAVALERRDVRIERAGTHPVDRRHDLVVDLLPGRNAAPAGARIEAQGGVARALAQRLLDAGHRAIDLAQLDE